MKDATREFILSSFIRIVAVMKEDETADPSLVEQFQNVIDNPKSILQKPQKPNEAQETQNEKTDGQENGNA